MAPRSWVRFESAESRSYLKDKDTLCFQSQFFKWAIPFVFTLLLLNDLRSDVEKIKGLNFYEVLF
jgi:hypothetical protein